MGGSSSRAALALAALVLLGCGRDAAKPSADAAVYEVRGVVRQLPDVDQPSQEVHIRHEAIPDFVDMDGEKVGMDAMTMPFPVRDASLLDGIGVGDQVVFRFRVDWDGSPALELIAVETLDAGGSQP